MDNVMTLKEFRRLKPRDFTNGAVLDAIEIALEEREKLILERSPKIDPDYSKFCPPFWFTEKYA